jgi:16S rRNA (guanine1207-N2)-methyltransferase
LDLPGVSIPLRTVSGVFAAERIDRGTMMLLRNAPIPAACSGVADVGTGYGAIALGVGLRQPTAGVWAVDVNHRAVRLTEANAVRSGAANIVAAVPEDVPSSLRFDRLYSNPPIKIGRDATRALLTEWLNRLASGGDAFLVVKQAMGADRLHAWLAEAGYPTERAAAKQGYRLLRVAPAARGGAPDGLTPHDLAEVRAATGRAWAVLGRLTGGRADSVQLLGHKRSRAVVKIKRGAWWAGQLQRAATTADALRASGYPTPAVLGFGPLGGDRFFWVTEFADGDSPAGLSAALTRQTLAAVELHAAVSPPPVRDWSAMITAFLNGGIAEHRFPPPLSGLARQALDLVPRPVPALHGNEFVHGDFTTRNLLADGRRLRAVIDIEGFGRGTRTIDLVALLASIIGTGRETADQAGLIVEHAIAASDEHTFRACLAHRVLAILLSTTGHAQHLVATADHARALLNLAR